MPPLSLVGDFGGGGMLMAYGIAAALVERARSGRGQVVDAAMTDGVAALSTSLHGMHQTGFQGPRGTNLLDGGAPFYDVYETGDGRYLAVAALEPRFYAALLEGLGLAGEALPEQWDREGWPVLRARFSQVLRSRSRDRWCQCFEELDACVAPVLELDEAPAHPHNRARGLFLEEEGRIQPAPAPRFSRTPGAVRSPAVAPGHDTEEALAAWGLDPGEIETLKEEGVVA